MKKSAYDKQLIELSLAEHLFLAEEYEKALEPNLRIGKRLYRTIRLWFCASIYRKSCDLC